MNEFKCYYSTRVPILRHESELSFSLDRPRTLVARIESANTSLRSESSIYSESLPEDLFEEDEEPYEERTDEESQSENLSRRESQYETLSGHESQCDTVRSSVPTRVTANFTTRIGVRSSRLECSCKRAVFCMLLDGFLYLTFTYTGLWGLWWW